MLTTRNRIVGWPIVSSDLWRDASALNGRDAHVPEWTPPAMVAESEDGFVLRVEVPGVSPDSMHVDLDGDFLTVTGERPAFTEEDDARIRISELASGTFKRRFRLGPQAYRDGITATCRDGILEIVVPKSEEARPRRIPVSTGA